MRGIVSKEQDLGGFNIQTKRTEKGFEASVSSRPEIPKTHGPTERTAVELMTTQLDHMSQAGKISG